LKSSQNTFNAWNGTYFHVKQNIWHSGSGHHFGWNLSVLTEDCHCLALILLANMMFPCLHSFDKW